MIPDRHTTEKMAHEHRSTLLQEAEHEQMLAIADSPNQMLQGFAGKLGRLLLMLGTKLQQYERRSEAVLSPEQSH